MSLDPYATLGVPNDASSDDIKKAHRRGVKKHHPDATGPDTEPSREKFGALQKSFEILSDEDKRAHYDRTGDAEHDPVRADAIAIKDRIAKILGAVIVGSNDIEHQDVRAGVLLQLAEIKFQIIDGRDEVQRRIDRLDSLAKRMKPGRRKKIGKKDDQRPPPTGFVDEVLAGTRRQLVENLKKVQADLDLHIKTQAVFEAMDYKFDRPEPPSGVWSPRTAGGATFAGVRLNTP